jgi:putative SOS response-associated peptidase YedK
MCGRYVLAEDPTELAVVFGADLGAELVAPNAKGSSVFTPNFNVAPTTSVPVVTAANSSGESSRREIHVVRWGVVPRWSGARSTLLVNARGETVAEKSTFKKAFSHSRCLIPASGYYEWKRPEKDPYYIRHANGSPLAMAGVIMESEIEGVPQQTCAIITLAAAPNIETIHDRMPATIPRDAWDEWLDPSVGASDSLGLMRAEKDLSASPVSRRVNSIRNNGASLLTLEDSPPIPPDVLL